MADNRAVIVCKGCRLGSSLMKYYYWSGWGEPHRGAQIADFMQRHISCTNKQTGFELAFESDGGDWEYEHLVNVGSDFSGPKRELHIRKQS